MSHRYPVIVVAVLALLLGINLWFWPDTELQLSTTSFGVGAQGYKAAYDLLSELGLPVTRSYARLSRVPAKQPLWLVSPSFLDPEPEKPDVDPDGPALLKWIRTGGTAVVFGEPGSTWKKLGITSGTAAAGKSSTITGDLAPRPRDIPVAGLLFFSDAKAKNPARVALRSAQGPFALEIPIGAGRLIAISDGRLLRNANLGQGDASVLVFDLARALGAPVFDERSHGLAAPASLTDLVVTSRAVVPLSLGLVAAMLWIAEQRKWPRRRLVDPGRGPQPSIGSFVESLGVLYSRVSDPPSVFRAYRAGFLRRLGRRMSPRAELSEERVVERLARDQSIAADVRRWLVDGTLPKDEKELVTAVSAIESFPKIGQ